MLPSSLVVEPTVPEMPGSEAGRGVGAATGGQMAAQPPVQVEALPVSLANSYTVAPVPSTRIVPRPVAVLTSTAPDPAEGDAGAEDGGAEDAAVELPPSPPPPQAAVSA